MELGLSSILDLTYKVDFPKRNLFFKSRMEKFDTYFYDMYEHQAPHGRPKCLADNFQFGDWKKYFHCPQICLENSNFVSTSEVNFTYLDIFRHV